MTLNKTSKKIVVFYPNWRVYSTSDWSLDRLPWDKFTHIHHSFWTVTPSSTLAPVDPYVDLELDQGYAAMKDGTVVKTADGVLDSGEVDYLGQFAAYKALALQYPDVTIMLSVGGWARGENFSQMASSVETRRIFIDGVLAFFKKYTWVGGLDLDWEYPSINRLPNDDDPDDLGCPGDKVNDAKNFSALLREIREAFDANGLEGKQLSICEYADSKSLEKTQELEEVAKYVTFVNVMTYDIHGAWMKFTGPQSPLKTPKGRSHASVEGSYDTLVKYFRPEQVNIGTPFYSRGWGDVALSSEGSPLYQPSGAESDPRPTNVRGIWDGEPGVFGEFKTKREELYLYKVQQHPELAGKPHSTGASGAFPWYYCKELEANPNWIAGYDAPSASAWLYSTVERVMLTYDNERSLQDKIDFVNTHGLGGIIVWEITGDSAKDDFPMTRLLHKGLRIDD